MIEIRDHYGGLSPELVASFEAKNRLVLPDDYRAFLIRYNGGTPERTRFLIPDLGEEALVHYFIPLGTTPPPNDLQWWLDRYRGEMPPETLVIGKDPGGNLIILACRGDESGICYWDHTHGFPQSSEEPTHFSLRNRLRGFSSDYYLRRTHSERYATR